MDTQPATFDTFHGGVTDYYLNGPVEKCRTANNLFIVPYGETSAKLETRFGSEFYNSTYYQIPPGNQRIGSLKLFEGTLLVHSSRKMYYINSGWVELIGPTDAGKGQPTGNPIFPSTVSVTNVTSMSPWNKHLFVTTDAYTRPQKIYKDGSGVLQLRTAGLPAWPDTFVISAGVGALTSNYIYALVPEYTYTVGTVEFKDFGPPVYKQFLGTYVTSRTLSTIYSLVNDNTGNVDDCYDTATLKVGIYRTIHNGTELYKVGEVTNGTTSFNDTVTDAVLIDGEPLYTTGGIVDNDPPPKCKLVHIVENVAYYACIKEGTEILNNRVRQSIDGDPDSAPATFYADVDQDIVGMSSAKGLVTLLCTNSVWRIDGKYDELGRGGMVPTRISDTASCVSSDSVVQTFDGVFWAGEDGFYYTDGYNVIKLNEDQDKSYAEFVSTADRKRRIQGRYDSVHRRIFWTIQGSGANDCDTIAVLYLNWGVSKNSAFTYLKDDGLDNFAPTAIEVDRDMLIRGDRRGYLFIHKDSIYSDLNIDLTTAVANWHTVAIRYEYQSCSTNFGTDFERKFVTWINVQAKNDTDLALQVVSNNDDGRLVKNLAPINFNANMIWGDPSEIWGDNTNIWNYQGYIEEMRRFPAGSLRCSYKSIILQNAYINLYNSNLLGNVVVDSVAKTATLVSATLQWPDNIEGYYISFDSNFTYEYMIKSHSTNVITFEDASNKSVDVASATWYIRGYPKNQILNLISYTMHYAVVGKTQDKFQKSETNSIGG